MHEGLEAEGPHVLAVHEWQGTEIPCGDESLSDGFVISGGYFCPSPEIDEVFTAKVEQFDSNGSTAKGDTDVAIPTGE